MFRVYGFDLKRDLKKIKKIDDDLIISWSKDLIEQFRADDYHNTIDFQGKAIKVVKKRFPDSQRCGKSYGYRVIVLLDMIGGMGTIFHIYLKTQKDDLTDAEYKQIRKMIR